MRIGVISEGHADRAVIENVIIGATGIDRSDIQALRPIYNMDETDKALNNPLTKSTWSVVKSECEQRTLIDGFLAVEDQDFVVIHIDTAEAEEYGISRPGKSGKNYCSELRKRVVEKINVWFDADITNQILYAIAIEEIDAWVLTIFDKSDSTKSAKPKEKLSYILKKSGTKSTSDYSTYNSLSKPLSKPKEITKNKYLSFNCSLMEFYEEVCTKVIPKLEASKQ
ncbi:MAG: hypothetical protein K0S33_1011 [Bacteroidetes bacterium]|jgi:hypothetical protein|nr:hypothetical protein [Bacteroidota bacterium]